MKRIIAVFFTAVFSLSLLYGQAKVVTVRAEGTCELSRHITLEQAEQKALQEAKNQALNKAGVDENVWSVFGMVTENNGQEFSQAYSEMSVLAIGGLVHLLEDPIYTQEYNKTDKRTYVVCKIHAEVKKGEVVDKSFQINVKGLSAVYNDNDLINMQITASQDAYLSIFWFNLGDGNILLPNSYQPSGFITKGEDFIVPNKSWRFRAKKQNTELKTETCNVMIVATKKDYPYYEDKVTFESLLNWIYNIPASDRCAYYETIYIK